MINGYNVITSDQEHHLRWEHVYQYLKAVNGDVSFKELRYQYRTMEYDELLEGIAEYNLASERNEYLGEYKGGIK